MVTMRAALKTATLPLLEALTLIIPGIIFGGDGGGW